MIATTKASPLVPGIGGLTPAHVAREVLRLHWDGTLPVRPEYIADSLEVRLVKRGRDFGYSGYFRYEDGRPVIEYNGSDSLVRQRFTVSHELGHYALGHKSAPRDDPSSFRSSIGDPRERAANQFAAELLMPAEAVKRLVSSGRLLTVEELARAFLVSSAAMGYRLTNLGLLAA